MDPLFFAYAVGAAMMFLPAGLAGAAVCGLTSARRSLGWKALVVLTATGLAAFALIYFPPLGFLLLIAACGGAAAYRVLKAQEGLVGALFLGVLLASMTAVLVLNSTMPVAFGGLLLCYPLTIGFVGTAAVIGAWRLMRSVFRAQVRER